MRYGLQIRAAAAGDAVGLAELLASAGYVIPILDLSGRLERLRQSAAAVFLADEWGPPSGLVVLSWTQTLFDERPAAAITTLLVGAENRRRGIGRALLKTAAQAARAAGCGELRAFASGQSHDLRLFCLANGFVADGAAFARPLRKRNSGLHDVTIPP